MSLDAPDGALEHGADLARLQVPEPLPAQLGAPLVPGAIESHQVQVRVDGAPSPEGAAAPPSSALAYGSGLRSSRRSDEVLCTTVTVPVFAPRAPSRGAPIRGVTSTRRHSSWFGCLRGQARGRRGEFNITPFPLNG